MSGREIRMRRLFPASGRRLFGVPLDHSVSMGPIQGLESTGATAEALLRGGVDLLVVTKGAVRDVTPLMRPGTLLGVHLSASTSLSMTPDAKVLVGTAEEAVALGADLMSVQVNFGPPQEGEMLRDLGVAVDQCRALGLPLMCMTYVKRSTPVTAEEIRHAARAVADLGADIVKTSYPGSLEEMRRLVRSTPVPVLLGGGFRTEEVDAFLLTVQDAVAAGGGGICAGRNLFQRPDVEALTRRVARILHGGPPA
jgi:DhnA family fructose-bisphosphate aldolase class Ia